jgi:hypothetical protein
MIVRGGAGAPAPPPAPSPSPSPSPSPGPSRSLTVDQVRRLEKQLKASSAQHEVQDSKVRIPLHLCMHLCTSAPCTLPCASLHLHTCPHLPTFIFPHVCTPSTQDHPTTPPPHHLTTPPPRPFCRCKRSPVGSRPSPTPARRATPPTAPTGWSAASGSTL